MPVKKKTTTKIPGTALRFVPTMEAKLVGTLPTERGWQYEPKWDGFRCEALKDASGVKLFAKSGKRLDRYFPEIVALVAALPARRCLLDGELVIPLGGGLSFDALQMRLHPAESRIRKLSAETPAAYVLFDLLVDDRQDWRTAPLAERRAALETFAEISTLLPKALRTKRSSIAAVRLSPATSRLAQAERWLDSSHGALDGLIAKRSDAPYVSGERAMLKFKRLRTADCVVGGFRYATDKHVVGSLLLGLYDADGKLNHVGFTSSIPKKEREALTRQLEPLREPPGFTGDAPGGPSRWSTERSAQWEPLAPKLVVEVCYDHVSGDRFRHGTRLLRWRPDKAPRQCTFEQIGVQR